MKKLIVLYFISFIMCSCSIQSYYGNISLLNENGEIINKWDNSIIQVCNGYTGETFTPYKNGGIEFFTEQNDHLYISGGIIIINKINSKTEKRIVEEGKTLWIHLRDEYISKSKEKELLKKEIELYEKGSNEYKIIKNKLGIITSEITSIENCFWDNYGLMIQTTFN